jgi:hypothetical protein
VREFNEEQYRLNRLYEDWSRNGNVLTASTDWSLLDNLPAEEPEPPNDGRPRAADGFGFRWEPIDSARFFTTDYRPSWLVRHAFVAGQPLVLGGPQKALKTSLAIDLAVSLASGTPWLGYAKFAVPRRFRVAMLSGESGPFTIQATARRICQARGIDPVSLGKYLHWMFRLPQLGREDQLEALRAGLVQDRIEVAVNDPLYLSLLSGSDARAENLFETGPLLLRIAQVCESAGTTPALCHHTTKPSARKTDPLDLSDLAFSGIAEFARQWLLVNRRVPYEHDGKSALWLVVGGSVGHGGLYGVDVDEGELAEDFTGRKWDVTVKTGAEAREAKKDEKATAKTGQRRQQDSDDEIVVLVALDKLVEAKPDGLVKSGEVRVADGAVAYGVIEAHASLPEKRTGQALSRLAAAGTLRRVTDMKVSTGKDRWRNNGAGYTRTPEESAKEKGDERLFT